MKTIVIDPKAMSRTEVGVLWWYFQPSVSAPGRVSHGVWGDNDAVVVPIPSHPDVRTHAEKFLQRLQKTVKEVYRNANDFGC